MSIRSYVNRTQAVDTFLACHYDADSAYVTEMTPGIITLQPTPGLISRTKNPGVKTGADREFS